MKKLLFILISLTVIWADKLELTPNMNINKIIQTLNHIKNNTIIIFKNGIYDFNFSKLYLSNKHNIVIIGDNAIIKKLDIYINHSKNIEIKNINLYSPIVIKNSKIYISHITSNSFIKLKNSICKIENSNLKSKTFPIIAYNSNIELSDNNITTFSYINIQNSNLLSQNNIFTNKKYTFKKKKEWNRFLNLTHSQAIIKNNQFNNNDFAIGEYNNSNAVITNNAFKNLHAGILIFNSQATIDKNSFKNFINNKENTEYTIGIFTSNSISNILNNQFDSLSVGVQTTSKSLSNINDNYFNNLTIISSNGDISAGIGVLVNNSKSNILNNTHNYIDNKYLKYYADENAKVFNTDYTNKVFNKGINLVKPININLNKLKPFEYKLQKEFP